MSAIASTDRVVLIRIPQTGANARTSEELYDATRKWWRVAPSRRDGGELSPTHALAVMASTVVAAYRIDAWQRRSEDGRWAFLGDEDAVAQERYQGADVSGYFPKGAQNPLRYVNCPPVLVDESLQRDVAELERALDELNHNPLAALMYGQRELFHSNVLAWFFEQFPRQADAIFSPGTLEAGSMRREVLREHKQIDLWMNWAGGLSHAIENKVFSLPDVEQLERYARDVIQSERPGAGMTLLSLLDPHWSGGAFAVPGAGSWRYLPYGALAERMEAAIPHADDYATQTVRKYAAMVRALEVVVKSSTVISADEGMDVPAWISERVTSSQLLQTLRKMRARNFAALLTDELQRALPVDIACLANYGKGGPHLTAWAPLDPEREMSPLLGLQIEGSQFRLMAVLPHLSNHNGGSLEERLAWGVDNLWAFEFSDELASIVDVKSAVDMPKPPKQFNKYDPDFIYRYRKVDTLTFDQVRRAAISHFEAVAAQSDGQR